MKYGILLLSLGLSACAGNWLSRESAVEISEVARSYQCNSGSPETRISLMADGATVAAWQQQRGVDFGEARLPQGPFALVEMGERNSGGYGLAISRLAGRRGDSLILRGTFVAPALGDITTEAITSPCVLISLPRDKYGSVEIIDQDGRLRGRVAAAP
ncbi:protease complex subunit PrcB family protein [Solimonas sp. K1W22B-7]|uniref:protease complex subunit PrcB family protein n=1 Tax=Solimonas sp. K1W22B-7 TaxID=2303331 RepID=UPI0013C45C9B|nr:protease complex subunit PrcB family protein [Solimonas sp. K1W22B-7]